MGPSPVKPPDGTTALDNAQGKSNLKYSASPKPIPEPQVVQKSGDCLQRRTRLTGRANE